MRISQRSPVVVLLSSLFAVAAARMPAAAQSTPRGFVRVAARDSTGQPIAGGELTITRGLHDVVASGTTDDNGLGLLSVPVKDSTDLQVTLRKIGFARTDHFIDAAPFDTTAVVMVAARASATALGAVRITAKRDVKAASYDINADDIAAATMPLDNGWDVVKKLRPDMLTSRGGCATGIQNVWVNGKRIVLPLYPTGMAAARARVGVPPRARFSYIPVSVLSDIAPEHIQEMTYHDCFDASMAKVGSTDALFIVLKPGVVYQRDVGSFVDDTTGRVKAK